MSGGSLIRLRAWMKSAGAGAAFITDPVSIGYLTGFLAEPHERLLALVVTEAGAALIVPGLEEETASRTAQDVELRIWLDGTDPWREVSAALQGAGGGLAVEKNHLTLQSWERLQALASPEAAPLDAGSVIRAMRALKDPIELARLERAAQISDQVTMRALASVEPGRSELEIANEVEMLIASAGAQLSFETIVGTGTNTALPHLRPGPHRIREGDLFLIDCGAAWEGYRGDISRTIVVGESDRRQRDVFSVVLEAHDAALAEVRAGVSAGQVDAAARAVIRGAALGDFFIHRTGHGLGLEAHEHPSLDPGSDTVLETGMVITIEPGVYLPGWGGVRLEDDVVVELRRGRPLTQAELSLQKPD